MSYGGRGVADLQHQVAPVEKAQFSSGATTTGAGIRSAGAARAGTGADYEWNNGYGWGGPYGWNGWYIAPYYRSGRGWEDWHRAIIMTMATTATSDLGPGRPGPSMAPNHPQRFMPSGPGPGSGPWMGAHQPHHFMPTGPAPAMGPGWATSPTTS